MPDNFYRPRENVVTFEVLALISIDQVMDFRRVRRLFSQIAISYFSPEHAITIGINWDRLILRPSIILVKHPMQRIPKEIISAHNQLPINLPSGRDIIQAHPKAHKPIDTNQPITNQPIKNSRLQLLNASAFIIIHCSSRTEDTSDQLQTGHSSARQHRPK